MSLWKIKVVLIGLEIFAFLILDLWDAISIWAFTPPSLPCLIPNYFLHIMQHAVLVNYLPNTVKCVFPSIIKMSQIFSLLFPWWGHACVGIIIVFIFIIWSLSKHGQMFNNDFKNQNTTVNPQAKSEMDCQF